MNTQQQNHTTQGTVTTHNITPQQTNIINISTSNITTKDEYFKFSDSERENYGKQLASKMRNQSKWPSITDNEYSFMKDCIGIKMKFKMAELQSELPNSVNVNVYDSWFKATKSGKITNSNGDYSDDDFFMLIRRFYDDIRIITQTIKYVKSRDAYIVKLGGKKESVFSLSKTDESFELEESLETFVHSMSEEGGDISELTTKTQYTAKIRSLFGCMERVRYDIDYSINPTNNKLSLLKCVDLDPVQCDLSSSPSPIFKWVVECLAQNDGKAGIDFLYNVMSMRIQHPEYPQPALVMQGKGGTGKGILGGIIDAVTYRGKFRSVSGFNLSTLTDLNNIVIARSPNPMINECSKTKSDMDTLKRLIDPYTDTLDLRRSGATYHRITNHFWFLLSGNGRMGDEWNPVIALENDPNSDVNRRFSIMVQSKTLKDYVAEKCNITPDEAKKLINDECKKLNDPVVLGKIKYWLINNFPHSTGEVIPAFHGTSFNKLIGRTGSDTMDDIFNLVFVEHSLEWIPVNELYQVYRDYSKAMDPGGKVYSKSDLEAQLKSWMINNLNETLVAYKKNITLADSKRVKREIYETQSSFDRDSKYKYEFLIHKIAEYDENGKFVSINNKE
ncbi:hypothetical protein [Shewanella algae]|uniref:hypothetical protein n=1 Tax=Shewanella algae TaxID=38313 RepID=UPI001BEF357E|nr:hypothetical protein [Shewanella algae]BCV28518.1 hypothetical protein TUM3811_23780 [Shewanella algae]